MIANLEPNAFLRNAFAPTCTTGFNIQRRTARRARLCALLLNLSVNRDYLLNSINWLIFIMKAHCVFYAVGA
jgi:hypothetical protein